MDPVNSTTFIKRPPIPARGEETLFVARDILLNRLFLGNYVERRHVRQIGDYRDVITISTAETELIADLDKIRQRIYRDCGAKWVGITGPDFENAPMGYRLWVKLANVPFGQFWFQIKQIKRDNEEIIFRLKCIRPVRAEDYENTSKCVKQNLEGDQINCNEGPSEYEFEFDPVEKLTTLCLYVNEAVRQIIPHITWRNLLVAVKFIIVLVIGCIIKVLGGLLILIVSLLRTQSQPKLPLPGSRQMSFKVVPTPAPSNSAIVVPADWRERNRALKLQLLS